MAERNKIFQPCEPDADNSAVGKRSLMKFDIKAYPCDKSFIYVWEIMVPIISYDEIQRLQKALRVFVYV